MLNNDGRTDGRTNGRKLARLCLPAKAGATKRTNAITLTFELLEKLIISLKSNYYSNGLHINILLIE